MGLPQATSSPTSSSQAPTATATPAKPTSISQLPPEAIELATKLFDFARSGDTASLTQYLSAGIPANLTNHKGDTLLMLAAYHGNVEGVRVLIQKGADVDAINDRGQSPIAGAVFKGYDEVVKVLVEEGKADIHAGQPSAVQAAMMFKREECLRILGVEGAEGVEVQWPQ
jgi:ankyrin repeat protein